MIASLDTDREEIMLTFTLLETGGTIALEMSGVDCIYLKAQLGAEVIPATPVEAWAGSSYEGGRSNFPNPCAHPWVGRKITVVRGLTPGARPSASAVVNYSVAGPVR